MNPVIFGKMISDLRKKVGLTQAGLAQKLHVTDKAVSRWENGAGYPEITQLPVLAEIFGVSVDYLLKGNPRGIMVAGNIIVDLIHLIDAYPQKNMLADVVSVSKAVGGCAPNTVISLAKINPDLQLSAAGKIGNDENGRFVLSQLKKYGIDTGLVTVTEEAPTSFCNVMTEQSTGERTFFHGRGANKLFGLSDIDVYNLDCEIFHIGYVMLLDEFDQPDPEYGTKMAHLLHDLSIRGIKTSIDTVSSQSGDFRATVTPSLRYCNYAIMNEIESGLISGISPRNEDGSLNIENIRATMAFLVQCGVKEKVIVHCSEAGFMMNADGTFLAVPSLQLPKGYIKGSVGAGDTYAAGCLYGIYCGFDDRYILEFASGASAANLSEADSISGVKSHKEIEKLLTQYPRMKL